VPRAFEWHNGRDGAGIGKNTIHLSLLAAHMSLIRLTLHMLLIQLTCYCDIDTIDMSLSSLCN